MKVITLCGSYRFYEQMLQTAEQMALAGHCMLTPLALTRPDKSDYTEQELRLLGQLHLEKIRRSDAILVMNVGGYVGEATMREIAFAKEQGKEILYYEAQI